MTPACEIASDAVPTWAHGTTTDTTGERSDAQPDWHAVDRALRGIALRRGELDAEEARWLREAEALQIWIPLGMVSILDYMDRVMGYAPRTAKDRLRVARALENLPRLATALSAGGLPFSAVRELTRVVVPATEEAWITAAAGKNLRQIEEMVSGRRPGDAPSDPQDPDVRTHVVRFELSAETFARLRQARQILDNEHGSNLSEDELVAALCGAVLDGTGATEPSGRARFQIALTMCRRCNQGWQTGAGVQVAVGPAVVEQAMCDAQHIGSIDGDVPERAYQDVSPAMTRLVWRRDGGRCRVPGCRSARALEIHHIVRRVDGGSHDAMNCLLLCGRCHRAHHAGTLVISGTADRLEVRRPADERRRAELSAARAHVGTVSEITSAQPHEARYDRTEQDRAHHGGAVTPPSGGSRLDAAVRLSEAKAALRQLGWKPAIANAAVTEAASSVAIDAPLERLIFEALRRCPRPLGRSDTR